MPHHYLEFEVTLLDVGPRLWRRFLLRHTLSFEELHDAIQMACGWGFCHLYEFRDEEGSLAGHEAIDEPTVPNAAKVPIKSFFTQPGQECLYIYDYGDNWQHRVKLLQKVALPKRFVQQLTGGEGMFPPEDCGGVPGYEACVAACHMTPAQIKRLSFDMRAELRSRKEWLGAWRPEGFDFRKVQEGFAR